MHGKGKIGKKGAKSKRKGKGHKGKGKQKGDEGQQAANEPRPQKLSTDRARPLRHGVKTHGTPEMSGMTTTMKHVVDRNRA